MASSLSSVVSSLVRASMGNSVSSSVTDNDLDRHVAELIVREAKKKAERYGQQGIRAYISNNISDSNAPKTNKRFLTSIIKSTDEHNRTILKAQAQAAEEVKRERDEQERRQRRARAEEATEAERLRRSSVRTAKRKRVEDGWDRWDGRTAERKKVSRNWEAWDGHDDTPSERESTRLRRRSRSRSRSRSKDRKTEKSSHTGHIEDDNIVEESYRRRRRRDRSCSSSPSRNNPGDRSRESHTESSRRHKRRRSRERSHRHSRRPRSRLSSPPRRSPSPFSNTDDSKLRKEGCFQSPKYALDDILDEPASNLRRSPVVFDSKPNDSKPRLKDTHPHKSHTSHPRPDPPTAIPKVELASRPGHPKRSSSPASSRSSTPGPQLPIQLPSKMDRYFEESYDPRLDVAPLAAPNVPATGLINNAEFEGWDAMLELIRIRREDKEEKKRLERLGLLPPKETKSKKKGVVIDSGPAVAERWTGDGASIMDIEYKKRGTVREWDMGKEVL